ncbi:GNAT family N-acetyltransferase [Frigidibacter sp. ROC022]|uniref:GNAT family N-acetyltransferase n=1 Tax=Frigidibacter sp. ROC022 TaxID=2971796 RepID=UPI00215AD1C2|nr:GNAT family protein [Frigidibacter sp. ROC022]MCR8724189.1 GNAT family N-acetyltransferase [Frigidibacter sp. ROC022]
MSRLPPRITLRAATDADGPALIAAHRASTGLHAPWVAPFTDMAGFRNWRAGHAAGIAAGFLAEDGDSGALVGVTNLSQIVMKAFCSAYMSYWGIAGVTGGGRMTEAVRLTLWRGFRVIGLHRIEANIQPGNAPSLALVRRLGFRHEGFSPRYLKIDGDWRDHERFAILAEEFETGK